MSTKTYLGKRGSILKETAQQANLITLDSPILSAASYDALTKGKLLKNKTFICSLIGSKKVENFYFPTFFPAPEILCALLLFNCNFLTFFLTCKKD